MPTISSKSLLVCLGGAVLMAGALALAGPLDPPAGPVTSSFKTLFEVEPRIAINAVNTPGSSAHVYEISQAGSYYLTENLTATAGKNGIRVNVSNVTIDLNGFRLGGANGSLDAIVPHPTGVVNIAVLNGTVEFFDSDGINLFVNCGNIRVEGVTVRNCGGRGIMVGVNSTVTNCSVFSCGNDGIFSADGCAVSNCTARACDGTGISLSASGTVTSCAAIENGGFGIDVFFGGSITACSAQSNEFSGIAGGSNTVVSACSSVSNSAHGFSVGPGSILTGCSTSENTLSGMSGTNITVIGCRSSSNGRDGFNLGDWSIARDCASIGNTEDGIQAGSHCRIVDNHCYGNGAGSPVSAALHATGTDNRIEGNHCEGADVGVDVDSAGNYIVRNTCTGNTIDWSFAANNVHGPVIDRRAPASPLVFGFAAAGTIGSADPHANVSY